MLSKIIGLFVAVFVAFSAVSTASVSANYGQTSGGSSSSNNTVYYYPVTYNGSTDTTTSSDNEESSEESNEEETNNEEEENNTPTTISGETQNVLGVDGADQAYESGRSSYSFQAHESNSCEGVTIHDVTDEDKYEHQTSTIQNPIAGVEWVQFNYEDRDDVLCKVEIRLVETNELEGILPEGESLINLEVEYIRDEADIANDSDVLVRFQLKTEFVEKYDSIKAYYFNSPAQETSIKEISQANGLTTYEVTAPGFSQISVVGIGKAVVNDDKSEDEEGNNFWMVLIASILGFLFLILVILLMRRKRNDIYQD